ncbi:hypothetical protein KKD19_06430 [Patescibacteria group bacterium]|nr:hypothetical protein [Patescibacteria group bacterium]MBU4512839.1 hypothetical protein [Patescibacteria group bacterium]MCG2688185.1 hypothetical protein [Candidatus Parcubacteria bacterium]
MLIQKKSSKEINKISKKELKLIGTALYWAEGYKKTNWTLVFCNSDPDIIKIIMRFFRETCKVPEKKFKVKVQIHPNIPEMAAKKYWSKVAKLSISKFRKSLKQLPKSSKSKRKFNTLPYGTFRISISDVRLVNKIKGWIKGIVIESLK